ncbi:efflux RND transporter periplasmic adaptor subunit [Dysgonomonas macrotermitis]|uniref:HlyD family secretion protein n=1 Tax=Dysgonomonas macrotermitis TaxID=1346286 RepID=A0A1M4TTF1_9BACT|nr:efflux RND transporter periplasmic adaptor subunit [Dysgonomonas macrotermitis]SHE47723.1 HlyD family secretion protein [Dysgonomonas macrotermitis]
MSEGHKKKSVVKKVFKTIGLVLLAAIFIGFFFFLWQKSQPKEVIYEIVEVKDGDIESSTVATGKVSPRDEVLIKPQISGIVTEVLKEAGDFVKAGEVIAKIQVVPESSSLSAAESQLNVSKINLNLSKTEYERQKQLYAKGVIAKEEMDQSEASYKKAQEDTENAKNNLDIIKTGVSKVTAQYSNTQIRSTIDGMILDVPIKVGNSVIQANNFNEGTTIATVANMSDMIFIGKVDETEVGRVRVGMPIKLSIGAIEGKKFDALLEYVAPQGVEENGAILFEIKAAAQITDSIDIRAGYSANAQIIFSKANQVLTIPESCVSFSNDSAFVYTLKEETPKQVFEKKHVKLGLSDGINIEVKSGLVKGDKIRGNEASDKPEAGSEEENKK